MQKGFIQLNRSEDTEVLLSKYPKAFLLLTQIAIRARREDSKLLGLLKNQSLIGDHKSCGLSQREYRTAKQLLQRLSLCCFKTTNKGTIATMLNTDVYNINSITSDKPETSQRQASDKPETNQRQASDKQETTNNNVKKEKNDNKVNKENIYKDFDFYKNEFIVVWEEFLKLKKNKKASTTERALKSQLNKIKKYSSGNYGVALEILEKSVNSGWTDFYEQKNGNKTATQDLFSQPVQTSIKEEEDEEAKYRNVTGW